MGAIVTHHTALPDTAQKTDFYNMVDSSTVSGIVNDDIASNAAIADSKLATIRTAGKVGGAALTELANIPAGAGSIPSANITSLPDSSLATISTAGKVSATAITDLGSIGGGTLPIASGGTGQVTAQAAIDALLPAQDSANGKYLTSNGSTSSWGDVTIPTVKQVLCGVSTTTSASARYVGLFSSVENASITPDQKTYFPIAGTLKNMYFSCQNTNVDITIYKNGSATTLTLRSIYGVASDTTHTVAIAAGDYISVLHSATASGMLSLEFDPS